MLYDFRKPKPGHRGTRRLLQASSESLSLQVPLSGRGGGWDQLGMLVVEDLQPPVLSHPQISLFYSLALLSLEAGMGGFLLRGPGAREGAPALALPVPKGPTVQGSLPQLHDFLGSPRTYRGGQFSLSEAAPSLPCQLCLLGH